MTPGWLKKIVRECEFRHPSNPPRKTYYRRAVYALALDRLQEIAAAIGGHDTKHTGKVYRDTHGEAVGRGKGVMPGLSRRFRELKHGWSQGPAHLVKTIREQKSPDYFTLLAASINAVEHEQGEQLELFVKGAPQAELAKLPPVTFPPHAGNARCSHCRKAHPAELHRFHLKGSFDETHPSPEVKKLRAADRAADADRLADEVPF